MDFSERVATGHLTRCVTILTYIHGVVTWPPSRYLMNPKKYADVRVLWQNGLEPRFTWISSRRSPVAHLHGVCTKRHLLHMAHFKKFHLRIQHQVNGFRSEKGQSRSGRRPALFENARSMSNVDLTTKVDVRRPLRSVVDFV